MSNGVQSFGVPLATNEIQTEGLRTEYKPIFVALAILGVVALGVFCTGLASLGAHQNWWSAEGLSHLSQAHAVAMMVLGCLPAVVAVMTMCIPRLCQDKKDQDPSETFLKEIREHLSIRSYTLVPVEEGNPGAGYFIVYKTDKLTGVGKTVRTRQDFLAAQHQWNVIQYQFVNLYPLPADWQ